LSNAAPHEELYALRGRYFELYTKQHGLESNLFLAPGEGDATPVGDDVGTSKAEWELAGCQ
jgi:hypothetical protein